MLETKKNQKGKSLLIKNEEFKCGKSSLIENS